MLERGSGPSFAPTLDIGRDVPGLAPSSGVTGGVTAPSIRTEPLSPISALFSARWPWMRSTRSRRAN